MLRLSVWSAAVVLCLAGGGRARADWSLVTADGGEQAHLTVNTWDVGQGLAVTNAGGALARVATRDVVALAAMPPAASAKGEGWRLTLRNGDALYGEPAGISGQSLEYRVRELGMIAVPLKLAASLAEATSPTDAEGGGGQASDKDEVYLNNGDAMGGIIASVAADKVQIATGVGEGVGGDAATTNIAMSLVKRIAFAGATPPRTVPALSARVTFRSGTTLTVPLDAHGGFAWSIKELTLTDPAGQAHKVSTDEVARIDILGGRVVALADIDPARDEQTSFMGAHWPTRVDRNVMGGPLVVDKVMYPRGLGVHTQSVLAYDLDGSFDTLTARVGIDDSAAPEGEADVAVVLDGKVLWKKDDLKAGDLQGLSLPIKGGTHLELRAAAAKGRAGVDVLGRVDWIGAAVQRE